MRNSEREKVLDDVAKGVMSEWSLKKFRRSHPTLLRTILEAMEEYHQQRRNENPY